jgi:hypothetical protein
MAVSLYLFSGGDPSRTLSAQTDSGKPAGNYNAAARRFLQDARQKVKQGKTAEARRLAETAASLSAEWNEGEETPEEFLDSLAEPVAKQGVDFDFEKQAASTEMAETDDSASADSEEVNPFEELADADVEAPMASNDLLKKKQAQRLVKEARFALAKGPFACCSGSTATSLVGTVG